MENSTEEKRIKFIQEIAKSKIPNATYHKTFIEVFGHFRDADIKIDKTQGTHLTKIYQYFEKEYPALQTITGKGKKEVLRKYLQDLFNNTKTDIEISDRPQPPTHSQYIPTPEPISELSTLEFIGREKDLHELAKRRQQYKIVLIKAGAGVGKSTLARKFLQTHFTKVIRIEMGLESGNVTPTEEKVSQILRKDFNEEPSRDFGINLDILREKLGDRANPVGVLIDNLEPALDESYFFREKLRGYDALLAVLGDRDVFSFTLITSRRSLITPRARVNEYSLEGLDITSWRQYFHDCENAEDPDALLQMCDAYNGNAKVMDILHATIKNPNRFDGNIAAYWSRYKDALLADSELETLISVEMDWLRDNQPDAYKLLCRMGCYRYQDVKTVPFEGLICLLWDVPESRKACVVNYLSKTSLIELKGEYYLHPIVRDIAKSLLIDNKNDWEIVNEVISDFYYFIAKEFRSAEDGLMLLESFHHAIHSGKIQKAANILIPEIKSKSDFNFNDTFPIAKIRALGYINDGIRCLESLISRINLIENPITIANLYTQSGAIYNMLGEFEKAINVYNKAIIEGRKISTQYIRIDHLVDTKGSLALLYFRQGEYAKAKKIFGELPQNAIKLGISGKKYLCYLYSCMTFLECLENKNSNFDSQINLIFNLLSFLEDCSYTSIKSYGFYYLSRILVFHQMFLESSQILNKLQTFAIKNHLAFSESLYLLGKGYLYICQLNYLSGIQYFLSANKKFKKIGAKYELADTYFQLGLTYQAMGEHDQAEKYKTQALELFAQMEAPKQIERVNKAFEEGAKK